MGPFNAGSGLFGERLETGHREIKLMAKGKRKLVSKGVTGVAKPQTDGLGSECLKEYTVDY